MHQATGAAPLAKLRSGGVLRLVVMRFTAPNERRLKSGRVARRSALQGESERSRLPAYRANPKGTKGQKRLADVIGPICQCLERFADDGPALRGNSPDGKRAADVRTHAFAEREHMPPVRQGLEVGSVAGPSPVRIALERDLPAPWGLPPPCAGG
jgi:hypothetical protein